MKSLNINIGTLNSNGLFKSHYWSKQQKGINYTEPPGKLKYPENGSRADSMPISKEFS